MTDPQPPGEREPFPGQSVLGSASLFVGSGLLLLALIDTAMPRFWYVNRTLWYVFSIGLIVVGCFLLRNRVHLGHSWKPTRAGIRFENVVLYTRENCHLCDHAKDLLLNYARYLPEITEVDIDSDAQLVERFGKCIPVVELDGKVRFKGQVDELLLRRLIEGTPPTRQPPPVMDDPEKQRSVRRA